MESEITKPPVRRAVLDQEARAFNAGKLPWPKPEQSLNAHA
jgi:hypothetical protein